MKNPKTLAIVIGALALLVVGFLFFKSPKPIIEIKAETIADIGPFPLVNTYVTSLTVVIVLIVVAFLATRKISLIPSGLQNVVEAVMEAFYNICINTAGEKNGRRFFPVIMTIFTFIWIANWMALLPFFNAIGTVEKVNAEEFKSTAVVFGKSAGISSDQAQPQVRRVRQGRQEHCSTSHAARRRATQTRPKRPRKRIAANSTAARCR